jgi:hypothetical protein
MRYKTSRPMTWLLSLIPWYRILHGAQILLLIIALLNGVFCKGVNSPLPEPKVLHFPHGIAAANKTKQIFGFDCSTGRIRSTRCSGTIAASMGDSPSEACSACINLAFDGDLQLIFQRAKDESLYLTRTNNMYPTSQQLCLRIAALRRQTNTALMRELSKSRILKTVMSRSDEYKMLVLHISKNTIT